MPKAKQDNKEIKVRQSKKSGLADFIKRPLPSDQEMEEFEQFIEDEVREEEIQEGLSEIYQDDNGDVVDVKKLEIKKSHSGWFKFFITLLVLLIFSAVAWFGYYYFYILAGTEQEAVELQIEAPTEITAGEEFFYIVNYKNLDKVDIKNVEIKLTYPENFIFLDSEPLANLRNDTWKFDFIGSHRSGKIKVKGKLIGQAEETAIILADMTYTPANFSSEFKKSTSMESVISDIGIEFSFASASSVLVGEENEIIVKYKARQDNYLNSFRLIVESFFERDLSNSDLAEPAQAPQQNREQAENIEFISSPDKGQDKGRGVWQIDQVDQEEREIKIKFKVKEKIADNQIINLKFSASPDGENYYLFTEKDISLEVIKSDLNLNLIINGKPNDQSIDFGQILHYSIVYANKGENEMKDVVIMAVLESDFLDWTTLVDKNNGRVKGNTISWSKEEIPALETLAKDDEGTIDFSIKVVPLAEIDLSKDYQVKSYVQYSVGDKEMDESLLDNKQLPEKDEEDMRSNTIINKINSDLKLNEQVRYFNDDNIAVGTGPLPPKVGETTSYKIYWVLTNNLHELNNLQVIVNLPNYVSWDNKNRASVGTVYYDSNNHQVIWQIGRLPITVYQASAEFNISITPNEADKNKIMVLLPGTTVEAIDNETKSSISKTTKAKTTKLEDDEIAESDGRVVE